MKKNDKQPQGKRLGKLKNGNTPCDLWALPKCTAMAKSTGRRCGNIAMKGKMVCYIHGGKSPGAHKGNQHALKHGRRTQETTRERRAIRQLIKESQRILRNL